MPDSMNDNLRLRDFVKHEIGIGRGRHAADGRIVGARPDEGMNGRRYNREPLQDRRGPALRRGASQPVFAPHRAHLLVCREVPARRGGFRDGDRLAFGLGQRHACSVIVRPGKPEDNTSDVVLSVRRKAPSGFERLIEELGHRDEIAGRGFKSNFMRSRSPAPTITATVTPAATSAASPAPGRAATSRLAPARGLSGTAASARCRASAGHGRRGSSIAARRG